MHASQMICSYLVRRTTGSEPVSSYFWPSTCVLCSCSSLFKIPYSDAPDLAGFLYLCIFYLYLCIFCICICVFVITFILWREHSLPPRLPSLTDFKPRVVAAVIQRRRRPYTYHHLRIQAFSLMASAFQISNHLPRTRHDS